MQKARRFFSRWRNSKAGAAQKNRLTSCGLLRLVLSSVAENLPATAWDSLSWLNHAEDVTKQQTHVTFLFQVSFCFCSITVFKFSILGFQAVLRSIFMSSDNSGISAWVTVTAPLEGTSPTPDRPLPSEENRDMTKRHGGNATSEVLLGVHLMDSQECWRRLTL